MSKYGRRDRHGGGLTLDPDATERRLLRTAVNHPCPSPRTYTYTLLVPNDEGELEEITLTATCEGPRSDNGFYGEGIVNALRAVRR